VIGTGRTKAHLNVVKANAIDGVAIVGSSIVGEVERSAVPSGGMHRDDAGSIGTARPWLDHGP
jgi:hypothetical protein